MIRDALTRGATRLRAEGIESARLDARLLLSHALGLPVDALFSAEVRNDKIELFESLIARRAAREPLAYITGHKEFWSLEFEVGPGVLIPRPETETLIEQALLEFPDKSAPLRVLDIGTGSGCLIVAFLTERQNATGLGIDISQAAIAYASRNAARHGVGMRSGFESAMEQSGPARQFDVILANPPYLTDEEFATSTDEIRIYEPRQAFVAGPDGLAAFSEFLRLAEMCVAPGGMAFFEIGAGQLDKVTKIVLTAGLEVRRVVHDLSGIPRCLAIGRAGEGCP